MQKFGRWLWGGVFVAAVLSTQAPAARAEIVTRSENGFVVRIAGEVTAPPAEVWKTILTPAQWWQSQHTFSGDAANLTLDPAIGGCFCEVLPRGEGAPAAQKPGGVQHMRVIYIEPPRALRLSGALGPLQSEALAATMTITVKPTEKGSRILFEYVVGGFMRYKADDIAPAVDRMLTAQLASLSSKLGPVVDAAADPTADAAKTSGPAGPPAPEGDAAVSAPPAKPAASLNSATRYSLPPAGSKPAAAPAAKPAPKADAKPALKAEAKPAPKAEARPTAKAEPKTAPKADPAPSLAAAKLAVQPAPKVAAKAALAGAAKTPAKAAPARAVKAPVKPATKAPEPEPDAHRDANAAFDAALGGAPKPAAAP